MTSGIVEAQTTAIFEPSSLSNDNQKAVSWIPPLSRETSALTRKSSYTFLDYSNRIQE